MQFSYTDKAFENISDYFNSDHTGYVLLVNTNNYNDYRNILSRLEADSSKNIIYISEYCSQNSLPDMSEITPETVANGDHVIVGISQALMLRGEKFLNGKIGEILSWSISGHTVVLLEHCSEIIQRFIDKDERIESRVVMVEGKTSKLPKIAITDNKELCLSEDIQDNMYELFSYLEKITDSMIENNDTVTVVSDLSLNTFDSSVYSVTKSKTAYGILIENFSDIRGGAVEAYGTKSQWTWLLQEMKTRNSFSELICSYFENTSNISAKIVDVFL